MNNENNTRTTLTTHNPSNCIKDIRQILISDKKQIGFLSRAKFYKASNVPKSADPEVSTQWRNDIVEPEREYKKLVELWRNNTFSI